ncbi:MAG: hypothetical protein WCL70_09500 [Paludibacter sp.]
MRKIRLVAILAIAVFTVTSAKAQFATGADIVSSYVWRGVPQDATLPKGTPNIQPYVSYTIGGLTVGSWASGSFTGGVKEVDLYATYAFSSALSVTLTDYNWGFSKSYFDYGPTTDHVYEATVAYTGDEKFPISASINTMFAGNDKSLTDASKQALSTYIELGYQVTPLVKVFAGGILGGSSNYSTTTAGVTNVGIKVSKSIVITDKFSLPVYGILGANPYSGGAFFVAGVTL